MKKLPKITEDIAKKVWSLNDLNSKKEFLLNYMGEHFNIVEQGLIRVKLNKMYNNTNIDMLVSNMMLKTEGKGTYK